MELKYSYTIICHLNANYLDYVFEQSLAFNGIKKKLGFDILCKCFNWLELKQIREHCLNRIKANGKS